MARSISEIEEIIGRTLRALDKRIPISSAYLFGSYATGTAHEFSDIDLAVFTPAVRDMNVEERMSLIADVKIEVDAEIEIHLYNDMKVKEARPTNIYGLILSTGKKVA